jgi:hypothetical protein
MQRYGRRVAARVTRTTAVTSGTVNSPTAVSGREPR